MGNAARPVRIDLDRLRHFHFARQGILDGFKSESVTEACARAAGIHAARLQSPAAALHARCDGFETSALDDALHVGRRVIKLRCMRRTLHIVPVEHAAVFHVATLAQRIVPCRTAYRALGIPDVKLRAARERVLEAGSARALDRNAIDSLAPSVFGSADAALARVGIRWVVKGLWEEGLLCYENRRAEWGKEDRAYRVTNLYHRDLRLDAMSESEAQGRLVEMHVRQYGPVSLRDVAWWSGLSRGRVARALDGLGERILSVEVAGLGDALFAHVDDVAGLERFERPQDWVAFLAYEDSALKGYAETRRRYVDEGSYGALFNSIGEVRASIVVNGEAVGVWRFDRRSRRIKYVLFRELPLLTRNAVARKSQDLCDRLLVEKAPTASDLLTALERAKESPSDPRATRPPLDEGVGVGG